MARIRGYGMVSEAGELDGERNRSIRKGFDEARD